jgi:glycosyl transferase family 25
MEDPARELTDFFPYRVCINLDRRPERWKRMESRFSEFDLWPVERFAAVDGAREQIPEGWPESPGAYGCLQSHLAVVLQARALKRESVLIMEDDILFDPRFHDKFRERIGGLPDNWDMLFFGCLHSDQPTPVTAGLSKLRGSFSTFMYAIRQTAYDAFIRLNSRAKQAVDRNNTILQRLFNCYCFVPHLTWVDVGYSDAQEAPTNHWYIRESLVLRGKQVKAMEERTVLIIIYRTSVERERGLRNLKYLVDHFARLFTVLVVECDRQRRVSPPALPLNCDYCFLEAQGGFDRVRSLIAGFERYERQKDYFIFNESNIVCSQMEMSANLLKCLDCHLVSSFERYIDLNKLDSDRLIDGQPCRFEGYAPRLRRSRFSEYFTVTKDAFGKLASHLSSPDPTGKNQDLSGLRIFDSPGSAISLFSGHLSGLCRPG